MRTSSASVFSARLRLSKVMLTSAMPRLRREALPLKMTSVISCPRRLRALCSPRTHLTASTALLLPLPLEPTMAVTPGKNWKLVLSANDLKPHSSRLFSMVVRPPSPPAPLPQGERGARRSALRGHADLVERGRGAQVLAGGQRLAASAHLRQLVDRGGLRQGVAADPAADGGGGGCLPEGRGHPPGPPPP